MNVYGCNTINSILSIRTYINTSMVLLPTIVSSLRSSTTLFRTFQSQCILIASWAHLAITRLAGITFTGLIKCSAIPYHVARHISTKNIFTLCPCSNLTAYERQQLHEIWPYMGSIIFSHFEFNPIYSSSNSSCTKVHLKIDVRMYGSFGPAFSSMKLFTFSRCLTLKYEACSWYGDRTIVLPFNPR